MIEIEKFTNLINEKLYYEAHEALEKVWFPIRKNRDDYCLLLKGFINAAVSFELYKRNKFKQSEKIYLAYAKYVTRARIDKLCNNDEYKNLKLFIDHYYKIHINNSLKIL
ncbi:MAG: hypothetical protein ACI81I_000654 [Arcobacteraceae bacterium]|jgi:hypothetical protein